MNRFPLVSVIIPVFNRESFIKRAVKSVLNQTYWNFELIVVDDGSTDNTIKELKMYVDNIKILYQPNKGVSSARNLGVKFSQGKYIAFLDSDDEWLPEKLERQVQETLKNGWKISQTDEKWIRNSKQINKRKKHQKPEGDIFLRSLDLCLVTPSAVMIEKETFEKYDGFNEQLPVCEDYDLWLRMAVNEYFGLVDDVSVIKYGGHEDQLSLTPAMDKFRIISLFNIYKTVDLDSEKKDALLSVLKKKAEIFRNGAIKRNNSMAILQIDKILSEI